LAASRPAALRPALRRLRGNAARRDAPLGAAPSHCGAIDPSSPRRQQRLCELPGVGPKNAKLLKDKGYNSVDQLQKVRPSGAARPRACGQRRIMRKP
jgi:predicted flap endonuclease-1-like 5' DNA nuclease